VLVDTGQSNMANFVDDNLLEIPSNLFWWNGTSADVGTAFIPAPQTDRVSVAAGIKVALDNPLCNVYIINIAEGSQPVEQWLSEAYQRTGDGYYDMATALEDNVVAALAVLGVSTIDVMSVWVGESDTGPDGGVGVAVFKGFWNELHDRWRSFSWFPHHTPIYVMGLSPYVPAHLPYTRALMEWCDAEPQTRCFVDTSLLPNAFWQVPPHMSADGYLAAGRMLYEAMIGRAARSPFAANYRDGTFTPTVTFATPGDMSAPSYVIQSGSFTRIGRRVFGSISLRFTLAFTTSSGALTVGGLPFAVAAGGSGPNVISLGGVTKSGYTHFVFQPTAGEKNGVVIASGSGIAIAGVTSADVSAGSQIDLFISFDYLTDDWFGA
jgi:hypothetical protein